ncbi:MAG: saccharopine dehydrogenase family protein [Ginsengibacter sp.]
MKKIAVLGAGMVGSAMALDLANNFEVTSIDINEKALQSIEEKNASINIIHFDLNDHLGFKDLLSPFDWVVTAVPGFMGFKTIKAVIEAGKNLVDISFFNEDPMLLNQLAKEKNVTAIVDCGVAPGMSNLLLGYYNKRMKIESFECMVGGLPKIRVKPFEYKAPFSPIDVIEEYTRPARYIENGSIIVKPALTDSEMIHFDEVGTLESFNTDGLRSLLFTMGHIPNMKEKTLRFPGHIDLIKSLQQMGFFSTEPVNISGIDVKPIELSSKILIDHWKLKVNEPEFTIMKIKISGIENGFKKDIEYSLFDEYDTQTKTSSMARTTGYTCTAVLNLLASNQFLEKGLFPPEFVGAKDGCLDFVLSYLKERNVIYNVKENLN